MSTTLAGLVARPLPLGEMARVVAQLGCDRGLHQHVPLRVQSVPVFGGVNVLVDTAMQSYIHTSAARLCHPPPPFFRHKRQRLDSTLSPLLALSMLELRCHGGDEALQRTRAVIASAARQPALHTLNMWYEARPESSLLQLKTHLNTVTQIRDLCFALCHLLPSFCAHHACSHCCHAAAADGHQARPGPHDHD